MNVDVLNNNVLEIYESRSLFPEAEMSLSTLLLGYIKYKNV